MNIVLIFNYETEKYLPVSFLGRFEASNGDEGVATTYLNGLKSLVASDTSASNRSTQTYLINPIMYT